jgi:tetratricopeptide (TPR) repeat protein
VPSVTPSSGVPDFAQQADIQAISKRWRELFIGGNYSDALAEAQKLEATVSAQASANDLAHTSASLPLAHTYLMLGKYGEAEALYKRALAIREQVLGASHPDVAQTLHNLANVYQLQGKYGQAEGLSKRALVIREQVLGANHPDVASTLNNLGERVSVAR